MTVYSLPFRQEPECGGTRCDYESDQRHCTGGCCPVDCAQGPWSAWSLCPATCGTGRVTRTRFVQRAECGGVQCLDNTAMESKDCEQYNNVDCKVSAHSLSPSRHGEFRRARTVSSTTTSTAR